MKEVHKHKYTKIAIQPVMGDDSGEYRQRNTESTYTGVPMALLYHLCECGHKEPFEYGKYKGMSEFARMVDGVPPATLPALR